MSAFGLDEYDSEARWYYPAIMRTSTMDPLCEKYYSISPYAWCGNNPVNIVDPDGRDGYYNGHGDYVWYDDRTEGYFTDNQNITWTRVTGDWTKWDEAITIRDAVIYGLAQVFGMEESDIKLSVELYNESSCLFTKEVHFVGDTKDITSRWMEASNSTGGPANQSEEIGNSGYSIKFYSTKGDQAEQNAMGIVKSSGLLHKLEAIAEIIERFFWQGGAVNDPLYDMHVRNAKKLLEHRNKFPK